MKWTRLWPTVASILTVLVGAFEAPIQEAVKSHPTESMAVAGVLIVVANILKSPRE
jgi:hypothetical protein